jgi:hypothetical protein
MGVDFVEGRTYDAFLAMERIRQMRADCSFLGVDEIKEAEFEPIPYDGSVVACGEKEAA